MQISDLGGQFFMETFWWKSDEIFGGKLLVKIFCGKYSVEWEGTIRLGERVDCWGRVDWEGTRLLTRPTIVNLHLLLLKTYK